MSKSVYIIILNWNGLRDTIECVESCLRLVYPTFSIVLVDNGSSDGSEEALRTMFPEIKLIQTGANLGYAGGNNAGIRYAIQEGADYIWLLNNDTVVAPDSLGALTAMAETDQTIGMAGSKIVSYSKPSRILYAGGRIDMATGETEHIGYGCEDSGLYDQPCDTDYITGCSMLVGRRLIEDIGLMDEAYFLYFEETEWCVRAANRGYRLVYAPRSVVSHKESVSVRRFENLPIYYLTRNRLHFLQRNGVKANWIRRFAGDFRTLLGLISNNQAITGRYLIKAYHHWLAGYMGSLDNPVKNPPRKR